MRRFLLSLFSVLCLASLTVNTALAQTISISDARAKTDGTSVTVKGVVTRAFGRNVAFQDATGGLITFEYSGELSDSVSSGYIATGDSILITGKMGTYNSLRQLSTTAFSRVNRNNALVYQEVTLADLESNGEDYESELIRVIDIIVDFGSNTTFGSSKNYKLSGPGITGTSKIEMRVNNSSQARADLVSKDTLKGPLFFEGILGQYQTTYQLNPIYGTDVYRPFTLTVLHNNDGESQLISAAGEPDFGGVHRFTALVNREKAAAAGFGKGVIMLSSGDNFLAGPEFNASLNRKGQFEDQYYDAQAMDLIGYDAVCIGNHDFDFGPEVLSKFIKTYTLTTPPYLSANLDYSGDQFMDALAKAQRVLPYSIITENGEKIGIIGLTTPNLNFISSPGKVGVNKNIEQVVANYVDTLHDKGVSKIILISHLQGVQEDKNLAAKVKGIDIVIAGGGDDLLAKPGTPLVPGDTRVDNYPIYVADKEGKQIPVVTTAGSYKYLGKLIVKFNELGDIVMVDTNSNTIRVADAGKYSDGVTPDAFASIIVDSVQTYLDELDKNVIAKTSVALDGRRSSVRFAETNLGNLVADAQLYAARKQAMALNLPVADVAFQNGGGIRNDNIIAANSDISEKITFDVLPFGNYVSVVDSVTPQKFKDLMENAVARFDQGGGTGRWAQIAGFKMVYDPKGIPQQYDNDGKITTAGTRILSIQLDNGTYIVRGGQIVTGAPMINVATADFTANGGDEYPFFSDLDRLGLTYQQALYNYIVDSLKGAITGTDYPEGGEGRITKVFNLSIFHNNDGESQLLYADANNPEYGGVHRFKSLVDSLRHRSMAISEGHIMLSSGDNFLPGPEFNASLARKSGSPIYDAIAMDSIGYDAVCIGNHDFDFGPDVLADFIGSYATNKAPYLSANLDFANEAKLQAHVAAKRLKPYTIIDRGNERIGVIGLTTPDIAFISSPRNVGINNNIETVINNYVDTLENLGVNKIILISHLQSVSEDTTLAKKISGVDVMIAGGGDELLAKPGTPLVPGDAIDGDYPLTVKDKNGNDVYVVTTAGSYKYVGHLQVTFNADGEIIKVGNTSNAYRVSGNTSDLDHVGENKGVKETVVDSIVAYVDDLAKNVIGKTTVDLDGRRVTVRAIESNEGNLLADALKWQAEQLATSFGVKKPDVAFQNGGGIRNDAVIPANSDISELTTFDIAPFANFVTVVEDVPAAQLKEIMENAVSTQFTGGSTGRFAQISGFKVVWDSTGVSQVVDNDGKVTTAGTRVHTLTLNDGTKIVENAQLVNGAPSITVATIDFLAGGGDQYPFRGAKYTKLGVVYQRALYNYIKDELKGDINANNYPEGGEKRIQRYKTVVGIDEDKNNLANGYVSLYPNPAQGHVTIEVGNLDNAQVDITIYNAQGQVVFAQGAEQASGTFTAQLNVVDNHLSNGVYVYRVRVNGKQVTDKLIVSN